MNLEKLVESYLPQEKDFNLQSLHLLYEEILGGLLKEQTKVDPGEEKNIHIAFPKIRITEGFGKIGTEDRTIIEKFTKNIRGVTLEEKLRALNDILTEKKEAATISEILSTMVTCEILAAIITNFTESAGGFIFEGFLAGLFGGQSIQITSPEEIEGMTAAGKPITDVVLAGKHYSLKLLGKTTDVKGSFRNMVEHFKVLDHVIYLDARRIGGNEGLQFGEFTITLDGFLDVFVTPFLKTVYRKKPDHYKNSIKFQQKIADLVANNVAIKNISFGKPGFYDKYPSSRSFGFSKQLDEATKLASVDMADLAKKITDADSKELRGYSSFSVQYAESKFEKTKAEKLFGSFAVVEQLQRAIESGDKDAIIKSLEMTPGYQKEQQFIFTRNQAEAIGNFREIGTLMIGEEYMKKTFAMYADLLRETITPVYEQLQFFTNNINDYFLGVGDETAEQDRKRYALDAINNAQELEVATQSAVEKIEK
tara:strand:- start:5765 stop:7204 length:1440 start_codon:yes stop_codon:yes gene_type:complete